jgi:hypothetical protein
MNTTSTSRPVRRWLQLLLEVDAAVIANDQVKEKACKLEATRIFKSLPHDQQEALMKTCDSLSMELEEQDTYAEVDEEVDTATSPPDLGVSDTPTVPEAAHAATDFDGSREEYTVSTATSGTHVPPVQTPEPELGMGMDMSASAPPPVPQPLPPEKARRGLVQHIPNGDGSVLIFAHGTTPSGKQVITMNGMALITLHGAPADFVRRLMYQLPGIF